jgi:putative transcriptional regulator
LKVMRELGAAFLAASEEQIARSIKLENWRRLLMTASRTSRLTQALLETAEGMHRAGILDDNAYHKITVRHLGEKAHTLSKPISPREIRSIRKRAKLSQAAMASMLNLTPGYVSQLERGTKEPKGPSLALLNIIRNKGFEAIL